MRTLVSAWRMGAVAIALGGTAAVARAQAAVTATPPDSTLSTPVNLVGMGPKGATLRCRDGSYPAPFAADAACEGKGGVLIRFRVRGSPPPPVARAAPAPPAAPAIMAEPVMTPPVSRANERIPAPPIPANATMQCRDETFVIADTSATRCAAHGGILIRMMPKRKQ